MNQKYEDYRLEVYELMAEASQLAPDDIEVITIKIMIEFAYKYEILWRPALNRLRELAPNTLTTYYFCS